MRFCRTHVTAMRRGDEDRAMRVSSLANEEPLVVVKAGIDIVGKVVRQNGSDGGDRMIRDRKTALRHGRKQHGSEGLSCAQDRDVSHGRGVSGHWGSEVFATW